MDITYDNQNMDFLTARGFCMALYALLRVRIGGSLTLAPVCSTWVYMRPGFYLGPDARFLHTTGLSGPQ